MTSPASLGFRHPAEWEPHEATWIAWPHNRSDWPGKFPAIPWAYAEIVRKLTPGEIVRIIVNDRHHEQGARKILKQAGAELTRIEFFRFPTDRGWARDFGPIFIRRKDPRPEVAVAGFRFTGWAKYRNWKKDAAVPGRVSKALGMKIFLPEVGGRPVVLEGGSIDTNGKGTLLTTEECLLDAVTQVRNPGVPRESIERVLREFLGVTNVLWLGRGIAGDDTHGHVDDLCRFVTPRTVVLAQEENPHDINYAPLRENRERLEGMRTEDGSRIDVVPLPMPAPLTFGGLRLPASYANFYIGNSALLVPTFNDPNDARAVGILQELMHDRPVVGIHCVDFVLGFGTLHCMCHEQPAVETGR